MAFGVPMKVITAVLPEQIVVVPDILAVGKALTVITAEPITVCGHDGIPDNETLTNA